MAHFRPLILFLAHFFLFPSTLSWTPESSSSLSRRDWYACVVASTTALCTPSSPSLAKAQQELPMGLRDFTKLAPLGKSQVSSNKSYNLTLSELADRLSHDLVYGSTSNTKGRGYILSGDLWTDIFRDDCLFVDPNNRVNSLSQYQNALRILFDPDRSQIQLLAPLKVNEQDRTISGRFRSRGFLQLPWNPYVTAYESDIVYKVDDDGLVYEQDQTWSKSASKALQESFTPTLFTPPPASTLQPRSNEPAEVTALFDYVNGRRPDEYSQAERFEVADLIQSIVDQRVPFQPAYLPGKWILVYLQPGPTGAGIDRRIPFPEFGFNDNYQVFTTTANDENSMIENIGELWGPWLEVRVFGDLINVEPNNNETPKRFQANIRGGKLCAGQEEKSKRCFGLPISGEGLFDSVYLGERLRIGQNLNGGGARVVQVRLAE